MSPTRRHLSSLRDLDTRTSRELLDTAESEVRVRRTRHLPGSTPAEERIVESGPTKLPRKRLAAYRIPSVRHVPGIVMDPGSSAQRHAADESVRASVRASVKAAQVDGAVHAYSEIVRRFPGGRMRGN